MHRGVALAGERDNTILDVEGGVQHAMLCARAFRQRAHRQWLCVGQWQGLQQPNNKTRRRVGGKVR